MPHGYPETKPDSIEKAIDILKVVLTDEQKEEMARQDKGQLIRYHHSLGRWIRNNFALWGDNDALMQAIGEEHPDDASMVLIERFWQDLNERPEDQ